MKKLLTILASAATMFAIGAANSEGIILPHVAEFEQNFTGGEPFNSAWDDTHGDSGRQYWYTEDADASNVISNYAAEAYVGVANNNIPIASRPDLVKDNDNSKFLQIETSGRLWRSVGDNGGSGDFMTNVIAKYAHSLADAPIYLDTLVKFTAADSAFGDDALENGDKIAISYVEHEAEDDDPYTNFVVRAGLIVGNQLSQTNYFVTVPEGFDKDAWHRLTVRTISKVGDDDDSGVAFVIYLDETNLTYATSVNAGFTDLNATAASFYNENIHALFPSAIPALGTGGKTISAASFSGNGSLDDVVFTTAMPTFIAEASQVLVTFNVDAGVSALSVKVGNLEPEAVDMTKSPIVCALPAGTTTFSLGITLDPNGYTLASVTGDNVTYSEGTVPNEGTVTLTTLAPTIAIATTRNNVTYIDDEDAEQSCPTLTAAFAAAKAGTVVKLAYDYDVTLWGETLSDDAPVYTITKDLVLDLNGKTLNGGSSNGRFLFSTDTDTSLTVIDSVSGDTGKIIYGGIWGIFGGAGDAYLGSNDLTDYGPVIDGAICGEQGWVTEVVRGKFSAADNTGTWDPDIGEAGGISDPNGFVSQLFLAQGSSSELVSGYWVVSTGAQPPAPVIPNYELTIPSVTGASAEVTSNGVVVADLTAIPSNTAVVVTWTLTEGYKLTDGSLTENITMDSDKTAATPTVEEITYATLTITQVANCTIVVSNATEEVATGAKFDVADEVQLTVYRTPADGYVLDSCLAVEIIMMNGDQTVTAAVKVSGGKTYPSYIEGDTAKDKYDAWATANNISASDFPDTGNAYQDAYLLNIAPDAADKTLKPTAITVSGSTVTITANQDLKGVNGKVYIKTAGTLAGLADAQWAEATLNETTGAIEMTSNGTAAFFKIKVDF